MRPTSRCPGITRRSFLADTGMGFTGLALGALLFRDGIARAESAFTAPDGKRKVLMALNTGYQRYGQCGLEVADWWRHVGSCADDLAVVRSLWTVHNDHGAQLTWHTGRHPREGAYPTIGSWI